MNARANHSGPGRSTVYSPSAPLIAKGSRMRLCSMMGKECYKHNADYKAHFIGKRFVETPLPPAQPVTRCMRVMTPAIRPSMRTS